MNNARIEARLPRETRDKYEKHAKKAHGITKLATWVKILMHKDYAAHNPRKK